MESLSNEIEQQAVPRLKTLLQRWRKDTLIWDAIAFSALAVAGIALSVWLGWWQGLTFNPPWLTEVGGNPLVTGAVLLLPLLFLLAVHWSIRGKVASYIGRSLGRKESYGNLAEAFRKSTRPWRSIFQANPAGWGGGTRKRLDRIRDATDHLVQRLNDRFTNPSGRVDSTAQPASK
ncbi:MAG: hypothetical protein R3E95_21175 [Thiolinea sp.]